MEIDQLFINQIQKKRIEEMMEEDKQTKESDEE